jgi:pimeloyl-ACP methyl ester carboxylesterase
MATLLLIHGFPLDRRIWKEMAPRLPAPLTIVDPDLPGCGKTPLSSPTMTMDDYARHLFQLMDGKGVQKFHVAGHSMGGYILLAMLRMSPERIAGGALVSSRALPDNEDGRKVRETVAQRAEKEGSGFLVSTMPEKAVGNEPPPGVIDTLRMVIKDATPKGIAAMARGMAARPDATPGLGKIACPVVVFAGRQDKIVPPAESEAMAKAIPGAKLVWCERSGHMPMLEEPDLVARELAALAT